MLTKCSCGRLLALGTELSSGKCQACQTPRQSLRVTGSAYGKTPFPAGDVTKKVVSPGDVTGDVTILICSSHFVGISLGNLVIIFAIYQETFL